MVNMGDWGMRGHTRASEPFSCLATEAAFPLVPRLYSPKAHQCDVLEAIPALATRRGRGRWRGPKPVVRLGRWEPRLVRVRKPPARPKAKRFKPPQGHRDRSCDCRSHANQDERERSIPNSYRRNEP